MELRGGVLPALPALGTSQARSMAGPTPFSNWVIPGQVIAGAYPASMDDADTERMLTILLELGINTFVCLQAEVNIHIPEHAWRSGMGLRPYIKDAQKLLSKAHECNSTRIKQRKIDFLHLPIIDGSVTTDAAMSRLADDCCERVLRGEKLYIHCWGGHGRTGTLVATMLGRLYNLPYSSALRFTQGYHDTRVYPQGVRSPQTAVQRAQVRRLLLMPSSVPAAVAARTLASVTSSSGSSPAKTNIAPVGSIGSGSGALREPVTPTKAALGAAAAAGVGPVTPVKQAAVPASFSRPGSNAAAAAAAAAQQYNNWPSTNRPLAAVQAPSNSSNSTAAVPHSRTAPAGLSRSAVAVNSSSLVRSSRDPAAAAANPAAAVGSSISYGVAAASLYQQQQQRLSGTAAAAVMAGGVLNAAAAAAIRSSSASSVLRGVGPRTPVQQQHISSRNSLLKRSVEVPS